MARSLLRQLTQINGSAVYDDTLDMSQALSGEYLEKDLNYLRSQFKLVTGGGQWFDAPAASLTELNTEDGHIQAFIGKGAGSELPDYTNENYIADNDTLEEACSKLDGQVKTNEDAIVANDGDISGLSDEDGYIQTFIGKAVGVDLPVYSSNNYVANNDSLETAIGKLDLALDVTAPDKAVEDIVAAINAETPHTLPGGLTYTVDPGFDGENMDVYFNGQLLAIDAEAEDRDYAETDSTSVTFHFTVKPKTNLTYIIRQ